MSELICCPDASGRLGRSVKKKPKIAVFLNGIRYNYQQTICEGIAGQAEELGFSVLFFASNVGQVLSENDIGELKLFTLPDMHSFNGIIVITNTFTSAETVEYLRKTLPKEGIPVVSVGPPINGSYSVDSSDNGCMETLIRHFITEHKFNRINFISGSPGNPDAIFRLNTYKRVLAEHGVKYDENRVFIGDFSRECAHEAISRFLQAEELPQAIVCANDNMALGAYAELVKRGFSIPEDIALSGYDCIHEAEFHVPRITTIKQPLLEMGKRAVQIINDVITGANAEKEYKYCSQIVIAGSCGCGDAAAVDKKQFLKELVLNTDELRIYDNISTSMMELLTGEYTMQDVVNQLASLARVLDFKHLYFCVNEASLIDHKHTFYDYPSEMTLMLGIAGGTVHTGLKFKTRDVLPVLDDETSALVFVPIYFKKNTFGYIAFDFDRSSSSMQRIWVKNVRLALENLRTQDALKQYSVALEEISLHDPLTGVLNRRGLEKRVKSLLSAENAQDMVFVIFVDLDGLKHINDTYGHSAGDEAIQAVADMLRHCSRSGDIVARMGGDEFVCVGLVPNEAALRSMLFSMQSCGMLYNERSTKSYSVNASYGWCLQPWDKNLSIMQMIDKADSHLYKQKRLRRKR